MVTVTNLGGDAIENYANTLFREWGIGSKDKNNGILLLVAKEEHGVRIEVGYGYEGVLTDARSSEIIRNSITPYFKQEQYGLGVLAGTRDTLLTLGADVALTVAPPPVSENKTFPVDVNMLAFFGFIFFPWISSVFARSKSWWLGGVVGGALGILVSFFIGFFYSGLVISALLVALGTMFDFFVSRSYASSARNNSQPPWWSGGSWGGGSSSGGGFSGFGGGSSGGGGASGSW